MARCESLWAPNENLHVMKPFWQTVVQHFVFVWTSLGVVQLWLQFQGSISSKNTAKNLARERWTARGFPEGLCAIQLALRTVSRMLSGPSPHFSSPLRNKIWKLGVSHTPDSVGGYYSLFLKQCYRRIKPGKGKTSLTTCRARPRQVA